MQDKDTPALTPGSRFRDTTAEVRKKPEVLVLTCHLCMQEEHQKFETSFIYTATLCLNKTKQGRKEKEKDVEASNTEDCQNSERLLYYKRELPCGNTEAQGSYSSPSPPPLTKGEPLMAT